MLYTDPTGMCGEISEGESVEDPWCQIYELIRGRELLEKFQQVTDVAAQMKDFRQNSNCAASLTSAGRMVGAIGLSVYSARLGATVGFFGGNPLSVAGGVALFGSAGTAVGGFAGDGIGTAVGNAICSSGTDERSGGSSRSGGGSSESTGRTTPANLKEKLAMEQAQNNPAAGTELTNIKLGDARWPASQGWVKMQQNINGVVIHYVRNRGTGAVADFKFK